MVTLLGSLPETYATVVTALQAQKPETLTLEFAQNSLLNEEQKQWLRIPGLPGVCGGRTSASSDTALYFESERCYNCDSLNHMASECPQPHKNSIKCMASEQLITGPDLSDVSVGICTPCRSSTQRLGITALHYNDELVEKEADIANLLNSYFTSISSPAPIIPSDQPTQNVSDINFTFCNVTANDVSKALTSPNGVEWTLFLHLFTRLCPKQ